MTPSPFFSARCSGNIPSPLVCCICVTKLIFFCKVYRYSFMLGNLTQCQWCPCRLFQLGVQVTFLYLLVTFYTCNGRGFTRHQAKCSLSWQFVYHPLLNLEAYQLLFMAACTLHMDFPLCVSDLTLSWKRHPQRDTKYCRRSTPFSCLCNIITNNSGRWFFIFCTEIGDMRTLKTFELLLKQWKMSQECGHIFANNKARFT